MFEIKYRIVDDLNILRNISTNEFDEEWTDIEGFFLLNFDGNVEGDFHENELRENETGHEMLTIWFSLLLQTVEHLHSNDYAALKVIETYGTWIEFQKRESFIVVSLGQETEGGALNFLVTNQRQSFNFLYWKDVQITLEEFENEVKNKAIHYISELEKINENLVGTRIIRRLFTQLNSI